MRIEKRMGGESKSFSRKTLFNVKGSGVGIDVTPACKK